MTLRERIESMDRPWQDEDIMRELSETLTQDMMLCEDCDAHRSLKDNE